MVLLRVALVLKDKRPNLGPLLVLHVPPVVTHWTPIALHVKWVSLVMAVLARVAFASTELQPK
jgi:hypothetical protein